MISVVSKKTVTQSFRFDAKIQKVLVTEAKTQRLSLNTLVSQILEDYVDFDRLAKRSRVVRFGPPSVAAIFNEFSEEVIRKIGAERGENHPKDMLGALGLPFTLDNAVRLVEHYLCKQAGWFEQTEIRKEPDWTIHLRHGISRKWSLFLFEYVSAMFRTFKFHNIDSANVDQY